MIPPRVPCPICGRPTSATRHGDRSNDRVLRRHKPALFAEVDCLGSGTPLAVVLKDAS